MQQADGTPRSRPRAMAGEATHDTVRALLDPPYGGLVLDAGAGEGAFTHTLEHLGYQTVAAGIVPGQFVAGTPRFLACDCEQRLPFRDGSFDGVVAIELIEHLEVPFGFVREVVRCLAKDGWFVLTTPNVLSVASKLSFAVRDVPLYFAEAQYRGNGHISPVSLVDLQRIAARVGLQVEQVAYTVGRLPVPKLRHVVPLRHPLFRNRALGESLVVKLRKTGDLVGEFARG